ncbi:MAG TPA: endonuclease III [Clostridia bacterium]|nr:endonuclease III [Clostridia bacterium]
MAEANESGAGLDEVGLIRTIAERLKCRYETKPRYDEGIIGEKGHGPSLSEINGTPLDILVATVLSQATTDEKSLLAYRRLKDRFGDFARVAQADEEEITRLIGVCGLGSQKARHLKVIISALKRDADGLDPHLSFLKKLGKEEAFRYLCGIKGIGPKTAACVLLFGFDWPVFPVDTHIYRLLGRLGIIGEGTSRTAAQSKMNAIVPPDLVLSLHVNMIRHGRAICKSRKPKCAECPLLDLCPVGR